MARASDSPVLAAQEERLGPGWERETRRGRSPAHGVGGRDQGGATPDSQLTEWSFQSEQILCSSRFQPDEGPRGKEIAHEKSQSPCGWGLLPKEFFSQQTFIEYTYAVRARSLFLRPQMLLGLTN